MQDARVAGDGDVGDVVLDPGCFALGGRGIAADRAKIARLLLALDVQRLEQRVRAAGIFGFDNQVAAALDPGKNLLHPVRGHADVAAVAEDHGAGRRQAGELAAAGVARLALVERHFHVGEKTFQGKKMILARLAFQALVDALGDAVVVLQPPDRAQGDSRATMALTTVEKLSLIHI